MIAVIITYVPIQRYLWKYSFEITCICENGLGDLE